MRVALFVSPVLLLGGYSGAVLFPVFSLIYAVKNRENTLDYSLGNTSRQALWLLTSRDEKYKAKSVIDATIVRAGDALAAGLTFVGVTLHFVTEHFIIANLVLIVAWSIAMVLLGREYKKREAAHASSPRPSTNAKRRRPRPRRSQGRAAAGRAKGQKRSPPAAAPPTVI